MKTYRNLIVTTLLVFTTQTNGQTVKDEFNDFRNQIMDEYQTHRSSVLNDYDVFLQSIWEDFETFGAKSKYSQPKPEEAPVVKADDNDGDILIPTPSLPVPPTPKMPSIPKIPAVPKMPSVPKIPTAPTSPTTHSPSANPTVKPTESYFTFPYRGLELSVRDVPIKIRNLPLGRMDFAEQWRNIRNGGGNGLVEAFKELAEKHNLNDYLVFDALMAYTEFRYPEAHISSRMSLTHYVMSNLGCDVRIALDEANDPLLLIPFEQTVYGRRFLTISGYPFYVFDKNGGDSDAVIHGLVSTCNLPADRNSGRHLDLVVNDLRLPEKEQSFDISFGDLRLTGNFNVNVIPVLYRYPQMPTEDFASSNVLPEFRTKIVRQVKEQLDGMPQRDAVNTLLRFTQSGFKYATDGEFHGFEKPYFFEEMFFYPKCDCEDRSIFYTYLLWNALGVENHLLAYPVHESASVFLDDDNLDGDHYVHNGKKFYISDPTYIGALTGRCMPTFRKVAPKIDKEYKQ